MLANNNKRIVNRMAKTALKSNRQRNLIILAAICLSTFMLFSVLTVGITYYKMWKLQNLRMGGAEFDAIMYGCSEEQMEKLKSHKDVEQIGIFAIAGYISETEAIDVAEIMLAWADDSFFDTMAVPARTSLQGHYPAGEDEVMVTEKALKEGGLEHYGIGDTFRANWTDRNGQVHTSDFRISGIWDGYGAKSFFYVSKTFYDKCGSQLSDVGSSRIYIGMRQNIITKKQQEAFITHMELGKKQHILFSVEMEYSVPIYLGLLGLAIVTCLCAYLLIYNIMYLSVTGSIRYYGLLQTIGMTCRQIYRFIYRQMALLGVAGISIGIIAGSIVSFLLLPSLIRAFGISGNVEVSFHPLVFLLTVALAFATIYIAGRKPAKLASGVSPIEASRYQGGKKNHRLTHTTGKTGILMRMGGRKAAGEKKKTAMIMLSLAAGISVFLCIITLVESQGSRTIISSVWGDDMEIRNRTLETGDRGKWDELLTEELQDRIESIEGVSEVRTIKTAEVMVPWEADFADAWMREMYERWMDVPYETVAAEYKEHPENFGTFLVGIDEEDFPLLNKTLDTPVEESDFINGRTCILYRDGLTFQTEDLKGKRLACAEYGNRSNSFSFEVAGLTDTSDFVGPIVGLPPTIIISSNALEQMGVKTYTYKACIYYGKEYDQRTEKEIKEFLESQPYSKYLRVETKIEGMEEIKEAQGNMMEVGIGISLILALIGVMNYINTVVGNVESRQKELAILESIGMTQRQINQMLISEGAIYALGSIALTLLVGMPVTYGLFQSVNYMGASFSVPVLPAVIIVLAVFAICIFVPVLMMRWVYGRGSVVERIRQSGQV